MQEKHKQIHNKGFDYGAAPYNAAITSIGQGLTSSSTWVQVHAVAAISGLVMEDDECPSFIDEVIPPLLWLLEHHKSATVGEAATILIRDMMTNSVGKGKLAKPVTPVLVGILKGQEDGDVLVPTSFVNSVLDVLYELSWGYKSKDYVSFMVEHGIIPTIVGTLQVYYRRCHPFKVYNDELVACRRVVCTSLAIIEGLVRHHKAAIIASGMGDLCKELPDFGYAPPAPGAGSEGDGNGDVGGDNDEEVVPVVSFTKIGGVVGKIKHLLGLH